MIELPEAIILDLDGTACNVTPIRHYVTGEVKNFEAFHKASAFCEPHYWVRDQVRYHHDVLGRAVLALSGRVRTHALMSYHWLTTWGFPLEELHLRAEDDFRRDVEVKRDMLRGVRRRWRPVHAWDDNPAIIELWDEEGIPYTRVPGFEQLTVA